MLNRKDRELLTASLAWALEWWGSVLDCNTPSLPCYDGPNLKKERTKCRRIIKRLRRLYIKMKNENSLTEKGER